MLISMVAWSSDSNFGNQEMNSNSDYINQLYYLRQSSVK